MAPRLLAICPLPKTRVSSQQALKEDLGTRPRLAPLPFRYRLLLAHIVAVFSLSNKRNIYLFLGKV